MEIFATIKKYFYLCEQLLTLKKEDFKETKNKYI